MRRELDSLTKGHAEFVARHLVMAARAFDEDPELAYQHAAAARRRAGRVGLAREAMALAAYRTGRYAEALTEFRALRRITGSVDHWPTMADCERGLGRPRKALEMAGSSEVRKLDADGRIEMRIVAAGARRDLGQLDAALLTLRVPELSRGSGQAAARLRYAYADTLLAAGREDEALEWFHRAAAADADGATDAIERITELEGVTFSEADAPEYAEPDGPADPKADALEDTKPDEEDPDADVPGNAKADVPGDAKVDGLVEAEADVPGDAKVDGLVDAKADVPVDARTKISAD